ncbi:hypothetical protein [Roseococcus thiosulfatophilus]|uniref:hypothetical protein n=1 Tax=Roseococcus thiosulfatophilus TaxID=35813 RepID=UPI001A8E59EA|nr:hypothetical protein [Roseococcus thiosulfatophilus]
MAAQTGGGSTIGAPQLFGMIGRERPAPAPSAAEQSLAREQAELAERRARLDLEEQARLRARGGALAGRMSLLGGGVDGVDAAEARGQAPLKAKLGQ